MKKLIVIALAAVMAAFSLAGCSSSKGSTVSTDGSTSMSKVIGALGEAYEAMDSSVKVTYNATGPAAASKPSRKAAATSAFPPEA